jgi:hypothetical protein
MALDILSASFDLVGYALKLASEVQAEKNTPEMIAAAQRQAHADLDSQRDKLEAIMTDESRPKKERDAAFQVLQILDS